jgi:outer membrane protein
MLTFRLRKSQLAVTGGLLFLALCQPLTAQGLGGITAPYRAHEVPPVQFSDSGRLASLLRAGKIYLSLQDAIALALENNLDIELQRYSPRIAQTDLQKTKAGGVPKGFSFTLQPSESTTGSSTTYSLGSGALTLEPVLVSQLSLNHKSQPLTNSFTNGTSNLISNSGIGNLGIQKSFLTGTTINFGWNNAWLDQNSARADLNPSITANMALTLTQHLLQGFGPSVNSRNIRIARNNIRVSELTFRQQVIATVSSVISLYWDLVSLNEELEVNRETLALARKLLDDNKQRVELGSLAAIEIARTEAEVARAEQDLTIAETSLRQKETVLMNSLTRTGVSNSSLTAVRIIPTDSLRMPDYKPVVPIKDQYVRALENRPEIAQSGLEVENQKLNLKGVKNTLLPSLDLIASLQNNALAGQINPLPIPPAQGSSAQPQPRDPSLINPVFLGGYGTALSQIFSRNFPDYAFGFQLTIPLGNQAAQADMARGQLELRQQEIRQHQVKNQIQVDVANALTGVDQARARYQASAKFRIYEQQTLEAEQSRYELGASTSFFVIQAQRDLAEARAAEIDALTAYNQAQNELDKATGETIDTNNIIVEDAMRGNVSLLPNPSSGPDSK